MLHHAVQFDPQSSDIPREIPACPGVFALYGSGDAPPYLSHTADLRRRLRRMLAADAASRRSLRAGVTRVEWTATGSKFESLLVLYRAYAATGQDPRQRLKLRPPTMLRMAWENAYPRVYATARISLRAAEFLYGPFPSRLAAERYCEEMLELFLLRRCLPDLKPDPSFPGCVYSEMKKCLAPCFCGTTDERYAQEAAAVRAFLDTNGASLIAEVSAQRDQASDSLQFEAAQQAHERLSKVKAAAQLAGDFIHPLAHWDAVLLQPSSEPDHVAVYLVRGGVITGPAEFSVAGMRHANEHSGSSSLYAQPLQLGPTPLGSSVSTVPAATLDDRLRNLITQLEAQSRAIKPASDLVSDHLCLLQRWYRRPAAQRKGEIHFAANSHPSSAHSKGVAIRTEQPQWPAKQILRGISRVFTAAYSPADAAQSSLP